MLLQILLLVNNTIPYWFISSVPNSYIIKVILNKTYSNNIFDVTRCNLKSSFRSWEIQIFVFSSSPLFSLVSHYFRGWSKKNNKVYKIINCLNKNLITYFVWYLGKEKRCGIETLSIDRELNKAHFYKKIMQKMYTKR